MDTIQVAIADASYRAALCEILVRNGSWSVRCVEDPDPACEGVLVLDPEHLGRLALPIQHPDRVVLIASNEPAHLSRAWEAGVNSVVFKKDPLNTAVLAIMSARLRVPKAPAAGRDGVP